MAYRLCPRRHLPLARVVEAWQTSPSPAEAARRLARTPQAARQAAKNLRALGVPLRRFDRPERAGYAAKRRPGRKSAAVWGLIRLARRLAPKRAVAV